MAEPASPPPASTVTSAVPAGYAPNIAQLEGGGNVNAQNPNWPVANGGPLGPHQFIRSTWQAFAAANPQYFQGMTPDQILAARTNPQLSNLATNWYASYNAQHLKASGVQPTPQNLAIAHALGGGGAASALKYADTVPLTQIFNETQPGAASAILRMNPQYQKMTLGDLKARYANIGQDNNSTPPPASAPGANAGDTTDLPGAFSARLQQLQDQQTKLAQAGQGTAPTPLGFGLGPNPVAASLQNVAQNFQTPMNVNAPAVTKTPTFFS